MGKPTAAPRKIFVAHAVEDRDAFKLLTRHAAPSRKEMLITSLDDVPPGAEPRVEIDRLVDAADLIVVLLSADLLGSELWDHEIARLCARRPDARLLPVSLRAVDLGDTPLARVGMIPRDGRPIASRPDADEAWKEIVQELRNALGPLDTAALDSRPHATPIPPPPITPPPITPPATTPKIPPAARSEPPIPRRLAEALRDGTVIPFACAGISMAVKDAQRAGQPLFPSWPLLLQEAAARLEADGKLGDADAVRSAMVRTKPSLLDAARNARDGLHEGWKDLLHDLLDRPREHARDDSLDLARTLWSLGSRLIITANHDKVLHWACPDLANLRTWDIEPTDLAQIQKGLRFPTVWYLRGFVGNTANLIVSPDGFERLDATTAVETRFKAAMASLRTLVTQRTLLFAGVTLDDATLPGQIRWLGKILSGTGTHYLLAREADREALRTKIADLPIEILSYAEQGSSLTALLRRLAAARTS